MAESNFKLHIEFHGNCNRDALAEILHSLHKQFCGVVKLTLIHDRPGPNEYSYLITNIPEKCHCGVLVSWALIGFFAELWQEVKSVETEVDGKIVKIFPVDRGTCS